MTILSISIRVLHRICIVGKSAVLFCHIWRQVQIRQHVIDNRPKTDITCTGVLPHNILKMFARDKRRGFMRFWWQKWHCRVLWCRCQRLVYFWNICELIAICVLNCFGIISLSIVISEEKSIHLEFQTKTMTM